MPDTFQWSFVLLFGLDYFELIFFVYLSFFKKELYSQNYAVTTSTYRSMGFGCNEGSCEKLSLLEVIFYFNKQQ